MYEGWQCELLLCHIGSCYVSIRGDEIIYERLRQFYGCKMGMETIYARWRCKLLLCCILNLRLFPFFSMGGEKIYMSDSKANCRYVIDSDFTV